MVHTIYKFWNKAFGNTLWSLKCISLQKLSLWGLYLLTPPLPWNDIVYGETLLYFSNQVTILLAEVGII